MELLKSFQKLPDSHKVLFFELLLKVGEFNSSSVEDETLIEDDDEDDDVLTNLLSVLKGGTDNTIQYINFLQRSFSCENQNQKTLDSWLTKKVVFPSEVCNTTLPSDAVASVSGNADDKKRNEDMKKRNSKSGRTARQNNVSKDTSKDSEFKSKQGSLLKQKSRLSPVKRNEISSSVAKVISESVGNLDALTHNFQSSASLKVLQRLSPVVQMVELPAHVIKSAMQNVSKERLTNEEPISNVSCSTSQNHLPFVSEVSEISNSISKNNMNSSNSVSKSHKQLTVSPNQKSNEEIKKNRKELKNIQVTKTDNENSVSLPPESKNATSAYNLRRKKGNVSGSEAHIEAENIIIRCQNTINSKSGTEKSRPISDTSEVIDIMLNTESRNEVERAQFFSTVRNNNESVKTKFNENNETIQIQVLGPKINQEHKSCNDSAPDTDIRAELINDNTGSVANKSEARKGITMHFTDPSLQHKYEAFCKVQQALNSIGLNISDLFQRKEVERLVKNSKMLKSDGLIFIGKHKMQKSGKVTPVVHVHESRKELLQILTKIKDGKSTTH